MKLNKLLNICLKTTFSLVACLVIITLVASNLLATKGHELAQLRTQTQQISSKNSQIKNQIANETSLNELENWAIENGFIKISTPIALTTPAPVAYVSH